MAMEASATASAYAEATTTYSEEKVELPEPHRQNRPLRGMLTLVNTQNTIWNLLKLRGWRWTTLY